MQPYFWEWARMMQLTVSFYTRWKMNRNKFVKLMQTFLRLFHCTLRRLVRWYKTWAWILWRELKNQMPFDLDRVWLIRLYCFPFVLNLLVQLPVHSFFSYLITAFFICPLVDFLLILADVLQQGWDVDPTSRMLTVRQQQVVTDQKLDPSKLQQLTEYVFQLEH